MTKITQNKNGKTKNRLKTISLATLLAVTVPILLSTDYSSAEPTEERPYFKFFGSNALYEPSVGVVNVFGPEGLFPFFDEVFSCGDSFECGVESKDAKIWGVLNVMGDRDSNSVYVEYTSPITYGDTRDENPSQIADNKYRIELKDTNWTHPNNPVPTATPGFLIKNYTKNMIGPAT